MQEIMRMVFDIDPCPASRPRVSRWSTYYPKKYTQFRNEMKALTSEMDTTPCEKLISVDIEFNVRIPKSWTKKKKKEKNGQYCDNGCDIDNYLKAILDSLNGVLFVDDRQVVEVYARKRYSDKPNIIFAMKEL
jgi:Holliday junction resolvase RusA-like endonuclease